MKRTSREQTVTRPATRTQTADRWAAGNGRDDRADGRRWKERELRPSKEIDGDGGEEADEGVREERRENK